MGWGAGEGEGGEGVRGEEPVLEGERDGAAEAEEEGAGEGAVIISALDTKGVWFFFLFGHWVCGGVVGCTGKVVDHFAGLLFCTTLTTPLGYSSAYGLET